MSVLKGYGGSVSAGGNTVGEVKNWNATVTADIVETSVLGDSWGDNCPTLKRWTASFTYHLDVSDTGQDQVDTDLDAGSELALILYAGGTTGTGNRSYTGNCLVDSYAITNDVAGVVEVAVSVTGTGALTQADLV